MAASFLFSLIQLGQGIAVDGIFSWGLKYESASYISTVKLMEPVFASVLGLLIFGEAPDLIVVIGGCIVILGVYLYAGFAEKK